MAGTLPRISEIDWEPNRRYLKDPPARCWVYEVWDDQNRLAYVGIADDFDRRWRQHVDKSWWLSEIRVRHVYVEGYRSRWEARQIEACVINQQSPVYNTNRELRAYQQYQELWSNPERPVDEYDCIPVKKRFFEGAPEERGARIWQEITHPSESTSGTTTTSDH